MRYKWEITKKMYDICKRGLWEMMYRMGDQATDEWDARYRIIWMQYDILNDDMNTIIVAYLLFYCTILCLILLIYSKLRI